MEAGQDEYKGDSGRWDIPEEPQVLELVLCHPGALETSSQDSLEQLALGCMAATGRMGRHACIAPPAPALPTKLEKASEKQSRLLGKILPLPARPTSNGDIHKSRNAALGGEGSHQPHTH